MANERDRVISISLTEDEWRAFVARQPRPVDWLRARILAEVEGGDRQPTPAGEDASAMVS